MQARAEVIVKATLTQLRGGESKMFHGVVLLKICNTNSDDKYDSCCFPGHLFGKKQNVEPF